MNVVGNYKLVATICAELQRGRRIYNRDYILGPWCSGNGCVVWARTPKGKSWWLKSFDDFYDGAAWLVSQTKEGRGFGVVHG